MMNKQITDILYNCKITIKFQRLVNRVRKKEWNDMEQQHANLKLVEK